MRSSYGPVQRIKIKPTFLQQARRGVSASVLYGEKKLINAKIYIFLMHFFLMSLGSLNPKIRFLGQKGPSVDRRQTDTKVKIGPKNPIFQSFEKQKNAFLSHVPRIIQLNNLVPRSKSVPCCPRIDTQTDTHESDYCGHPFRVSGVFHSTYHQGSAQFHFGSQWSKGSITFLYF